MTRPKKRPLSFVMLVVLSVFVVRGLAGEPIQAFLDGMYIGFTDDI